MYKRMNNKLNVEFTRMKKGKIMENNAIDTQFLKTIDKKLMKEEFLELLRSEKAAEKKELLDRLLRFISEMPVDKYHDYRIFRHTGLREYLINQFLSEKLTEELSRSS
jgi:hypothetical protein